MKTEFLIVDRFEIQASELADIQLSDSGRTKLVDSFFSNEDETKRGLYVTFDLTHSGKVINNRIYQPWAQASGVNTWDQLPVIKNHDPNSEPIGRIINMKWESLEPQARSFLGDSAFNEVVEAYNSRDAKEIGRVMNKHNLVGNPEWKGLGKMVATAKISDRDAIEKFIDGRYLQFSAGAKTNRVQCSTCGHNLRMFDMCEHSPGKPLEDGSIPVMVTNTYNGREASVVNFPADRDSKVIHLTYDPSSLGDNEDPALALTADFSEISLGDSMVLCDAHIQGLDLTSLELQDTQVTLTPIPIKDRDPRDVARQLFDEKSATAEFLSDLEDKIGDTTLERLFLIRLHDALHSEYDWRLKYDGEDVAKTAPLNAFKFHGKLHDLAVADGFRDDFVNGPLDTFDSMGAPSTEYVAAHARDADNTWTTGASQAGGSDDHWIKTPADYASALSALNNLGISDTEKLRAVYSRGRDLGINDAITALHKLELADLAAERTRHQEKVASLEQDVQNKIASLAEALRDREATADKLESVLDFLAGERDFHVSDEENGNRLDALITWFDSIVSETDDAASATPKLNLIPDASAVVPLEDPTHDNEQEDNQIPVSQLSAFEQRIVERYFHRVRDYSETSATAWLQDLKGRGMVSEDFNPNLYSLNSEE